MFEFHQNKKWYFDVQTKVTAENVIPFIEPYIDLKTPKRVLEIGCGEAGVLKAFLELGHFGCGIELSPSRASTATENLQTYIKNGKAEIITNDIYLINPNEKWTSKFDVIILKDVIEHIQDQGKFIAQLRSFLHDDGIVFFAYPPWWMPFGGHQQICRNKWLSKLPWFHLLPNALYQFVLKSMGESKETIHELLDVKSTGILIESLKALVIKNDFKILKEAFWLINPIYEFKFKIHKRLLWSFFANIPYLRNFYTTAHYIAFKQN